LPRKKQESGERSAGLVVDGHGERRGLDRRCARDRLDRGLRPAVGRAEGEAAQRRVGLERYPDPLEEVVEGGVARRRIALLEVDLDLDRMLIVGNPEAAERLLRLARIPRRGR